MPLSSSCSAKARSLRVVFALTAAGILPAVLFLSSAFPTSGRAEALRAPERGVGATARASEAYGRLPLRFEANRGQTDGRVKFLARGGGYTLFLSESGALLRLRGS